MAKDELKTPSKPLRGAGHDDSAPLLLSLSFFKTNGLRAQFDDIRRMEGKKFLFEPFGEPVVAIHSDQSTTLWIQTQTQLLLVDSFNV